MIPRSPCWLSLALAFTALLLQYGLVKGDADIESVRIHHDYKDMSGRGGDPKAKYWRKHVYRLPKIIANACLAYRRISVSPTALLYSEPQALNTSSAFIHTTMAGRINPCSMKDMKRAEWI